jgi:two-component system, LytTR family, sensor kinase
MMTLSRAILNVKVPLLLLYGGSDPWIPVAQSMQRLKALSGQLQHPIQRDKLRTVVKCHFLVFNALNSIHALVLESPDRAQIAVEELSEFLRYSLTRSKVFDVPLSEEIEVVERYLALETIRFEDKASVRIDVDPQVKEIHVPGFLLHPLLENSIKYGMQTSPMPLQIRLTAKRERNFLRLFIASD